MSAGVSRFQESDAGDGTARETHYMHGARLALCLLAIFACMFLVSLDQTIVAVIAETVGNRFDALDSVAWLITGFSMAMAVVVLMWGTISIPFGRRNCLYAAVLLFEAGSLLCALSTSMNMLIGGRVLAGIGGGGVQTIVNIIISEIVPINRRPLALTGFGVVFGIASVMGPLVGGVLAKITWRWCFYINLPVGGAAIVLLTLVYHPPRPAKGTWKKVREVDFVGFFILVLSISLILVGLSLGGKQYPWRSAAVILCIVLGGLSSIVFAVWNFRIAKKPFIPLAIATSRQEAVSWAGNFFMQGFMLGGLAYITLYFQVVRNYNSLSSGLSLFPSIITMAVVSIGVGVASKKTRYVKPFAVAGGIVAPVGCGMFCLLDKDSGLGVRIGSQILFGVAVGFLLQPFIVQAQLHAPHEAGGTILAGTFTNFGKNLGGAFGANLAQVVYTAVLQRKLADLEKSSIYSSSGLDKYPLDTFVANTGAIYSLPEAQRNIILDIFVKTFHGVFYLVIGLSGLALVSALLLENTRIPPKEAVAQRVEEREELHEKDTNSPPL